MMDNGDSGPGAQWTASDLHDKMQRSRHILLSFDGARRESGLGAAAWILWLRDEYGSFEEVSYGGCVLRNASAMTAEREALRKGIGHLTVLFPTVVSSFDFQAENSDRTVQYKLNAQSLRLFGLHSDMNDAHRAGANRLQNKNNKQLHGRIPGAWKKWKTWRRHEMPRRAPPIPPAVVRGTAGLAWVQGRLDVAFCILIGFSLYALRPRSVEAQIL